MAGQILRWAAVAWTAAVGSCAIDGRDRCSEQELEARDCAGHEDRGNAAAEIDVRTHEAALDEAQHAGRVPHGKVVVVVGVAEAGEGEVAASSSDPRARCHRGTCVVRAGATVTLQATAAAGFRFDRWRGCSDSAESTLTFTPERAVTGCVARFTEHAGGARFDALGDLPGGDVASYAADVSSDGEVVVGYSRGQDGDEAFRWTSGGIVGLGGPQSRAQGISPDGQLIVGSIADAEIQNGRAGVVWRPGTAFERLGDPFPVNGPPPMFLVVDGVDALDDGRLFTTCIQYGAYGEPFACRIDGSGSPQILWGTSLLFAADESGTTAGTLLPGRRGGFFGSVAIFDGQNLGYPADATCFAPHACRSEAQAFSANREVVVGTSRVPPVGQSSSSSELYDTAFVYTQAEGMLRLPDLPGGVEASGAYAVSADGRVIAGFGVDASQGQHAALWVDRAPLTVEEAMQRQGASPPAGWALLEVRALSPDGTVLVGNGVNPQGQPEAFRVVLEAPP